MLKKQHALNSGKQSLIFLLVYIAGMLLFTAFTKIIEDNALCAILWLPCFFAYLVGFPVLWYKSKGVKLIKLKCLSCKSKLAGYHLNIAVAADKCPLCGDDVFEEE